MLAAMLRTIVWVSFPSLLSLLPALPAQRTLAALQREFSAEAQRLQVSSPTREQRDQLLARQLEVLRTFVDKEAAGDDRWNGRLMLADWQMAGGDRTAATATLRTIDAKEAPALVLITGAAMAQHLNLKDQRGPWIEAALAKQAPLADRLAMARMLMTVLREVERGDKLFADALAAASDDEQRSFVRWHRADALRDREDLPDNAAYEELEKLAKDLPGTYWGSVARDRLRATRLQIGEDAIPFRASTRDGKEVSLADFAGKAVVLAFWSAGDRDLPALVATLGELQRRHGDKLAVLGICLDREDASIAAAIKKSGIEFPVIGDGKGVETDVALRWFVEAPAVVVVDAAGKVAGLGLHAGTTDGRNELTEAVARAVKP